MISFETFFYPMSMDEVLGERDLFIEYEFTDEGLDYEIVAVSANGDRETINHLLDEKEHNSMLRLIAQNEHEAYEQGVSYD
jgi:hypothetical protein